PTLGPLFQGIAGADQVIPRGKPRPAHDVHAALLSLPRLLGTTLATVPAPIPYLRADPKLVESWGAALKPLDGFKVGIAWQGSPASSADRFRSLPLKHWEPLAVPGVRLISLQKGLGADQVVQWKGSTPILDLADRLDAGGAFL